MSNPDDNEVRKLYAYEKRVELINLMKDILDLRCKRCGEMGTPKIERKVVECENCGITLWIA